MKVKTVRILVSAILFGAFSLAGPANAQQVQAPYVRLAELQIEASQLDAFNEAIQEGIATAVRVEPGVLALYAVSEKDHPTRVRVFEIYADPEAYQTHLQTPHFQKFRATTDKMVSSRKLLDGVAIALGTKESLR